MLRRAAIVLGALAALLAATGTAAAANTAGLESGVMRVTFDDSLPTTLGVEETGSNVVVSATSTDPTPFDSASGGCALNPAQTSASCPVAGTVTVHVTSSTANDLLIVDSTLTKPIRWDAGAGNDTANEFVFLHGSSSPAREELNGGPGSDFLNGGAAADRIDGGEGSDRLVYRDGDEIIGGPDLDRLDDAAIVNQAFNLTLDGLFNDGLGSDRSGNVHGDVEDLRLDQGADVIVGSDASNEILGLSGNDDLDGGGGFDFIDADTGDDIVRSRDGLPERVDCGPGTDTAIVDDIDAPVGCESVSVSSDVRPDVDADGARKPGDCNDNDAGIRPGAFDAPENGIDEDCDGADAVVLDRDGDGVPRPLDCDDTRTDVRPGAREVLGNKVDEDCDGQAEPFRVLPVTLTHRTLAFRTFTTVERLRLSRVRRGQTVRLRCSGGGCKFKSRRVRVRRRGELNLTRRLRDTRLRGGAKLTIRVTARNGVAKQFAFTFRRGAAPIFLIRCSEPGTGLRRCQS